MLTPDFRRAPMNSAWTLFAFPARKKYWRKLIFYYFHCNQFYRLLKLFAWPTVAMPKRYGLMDKSAGIQTNRMRAEPEIDS
jgi:hypothetical protein